MGVVVLKRVETGGVGWKRVEKGPVGLKTGVVLGDALMSSLCGIVY